MVAKVGVEYKLAFQGFRGAMQEDPLSPTIFNVVIDVVVRHWLDLMVGSADKQSRHRQEVRHQNALFYADDGMVATSDPRWLQGKFSTLVGLSDKVSLKNNVGKTLGMVCRPCQATGTQSEAVYRKRIMLVGPYYQERQRFWIKCTECGEEMFSN